jgi:hypothetical protein
LALYRGRGEPTYPSYSDTLPLTQELDGFLQAVRSGATDGDHIELGLSVVRMISAAERSIALGGQPVPLRGLA